VPIYAFDCKAHGRFEDLLSVKELHGSRPCPKCNKPAKWAPSVPARHVVDFIPGWNGGAGKCFDTKKDREIWMRESGSRRLR